MYKTNKNTFSHACMTSSQNVMASRRGENYFRKMRWLLAEMKVVVAKCGSFSHLLKLLSQNAMASCIGERCFRKMRQLLAYVKVIAAKCDGFVQR